MHKGIVVHPCSPDHRVKQIGINQKLLKREEEEEEEKEEDITVNVRTTYTYVCL